MSVCCQINEKTINLFEPSSTKGQSLSKCRGVWWQTGHNTEGVLDFFFEPSTGFEPVDFDKLELAAELGPGCGLCWSCGCLFEVVCLVRSVDWLNGVCDVDGCEI